MSFTKIRVGVLRGGPSSEYEVSLKTGQTVLANLPEKYAPHDIFISKGGDWHVEGVAYDPEDVVKHMDVIFNALHGEYGEDGKVQKFLEHHSVPFTGSGALASSLGMNKILSKKVFKDYGIKTPQYIRVTQEEFSPNLVREIYTGFSQPSVVKPAGLGSSVGVSIIKSLADIAPALELAFTFSPVVIIEEFIKGREATCGVIDEYRGERHHALMPTEIIDKTGSDLWGYESKYSNDLHEIVCPGNFSREEKQAIQEMAIQAHRALGLKHYSRSDFIVHPRRGIYILETNTLPGLTEASLFPQAIKAGGSNMPEFLDHILGLALTSR